MRIKTFYGTTENAIKTQIWIDLSVYLLVAIIKNRLHLDKSLYNILQVMSVSVFENMRLIQLFVINSFYMTIKIKSRVNNVPKLAIGDGSMGF